ncbi:MAG: hypothetical protein AAGE96_25915 [Cyanobacteria bacterium P01_G01_bin.19]
MYEVCRVRGVGSTAELCCNSIKFWSSGDRWELMWFYLSPSPSPKRRGE